MKKNSPAPRIAFWLGLLLLCGPLPLRAEEFGLFGLFVYEVVNGTTVTITDYPPNATGPVEIPSEIDGRLVTAIGPGAFSDCTGLTSVTIPNGVTSIGSGAFSRCAGLLSIHVDPGNPQYSSVTGVLFNTDQTTLIKYPMAKVGNYAIPSSVSIIEDNAFSDCSGLTGVTIPASVTAIHHYAFYGCTGLTSVTIPPSLTNMGEDAFSDCTSLTSVILLEGVSDLGESAFSDCTALTSVTIPSSVISVTKNVFTRCTGLTSVSISEGVTVIGVGAFFGCTALTDVTIPASVTSIHPAPFSGCVALKAIGVASGNPQYVSVGGVLLNAAKTTLVAFPGGQTGTYTIPSSVTTIYDAAFSHCTGLTSVIIPSSVANIGSSAFSGCTGLTSFTLPKGLTAIANNLFRGCSGLTTFTIPPGITTVGYYAFLDCTGLTSISIPPSVTTIEESAFRTCTSLTSITIPSGVTHIGSSAFSGCAGLTIVAIAPGVTAIAHAAFYDCTNLTRALFLGNAPHMDGEAFGNAAPGFTIHYLSSRTGFTSPTWEGYPAIMLDEITYPAASWLLTHGLWYDTNLNQDPDGDGISLLMAYALNLDPHLDVSGGLPVPVLTDDALSLSFHATSPGLTYIVETSSDLNNWTTTGVTQSPPGPDQRSTATVNRDGPFRFLRLTVQD